MLRQCGPVAQKAKMRKAELGEVACTRGDAKTAEASNAERLETHARTSGKKAATLEMK
jgi:hypothetical protein